MGRLGWTSALLLTVMLTPAQVIAQQRATVVGQVLDGAQAPLSAAQITVAAVRVTSLTDGNGRFTLQLPIGTHTLRVSLLGYRDAVREVVVTSQGLSVTIGLDADPLRLDELIVTGYSLERRRYVTGAITSVKPATVREIPITQIDELLRGRAPGVQVTQNSGTPGAALTVRVRGSSSISGGNDPLYVLDGVPVTQGNYSRLGGFGGQSIDAIGDLNPNDIESVEILKDAAAAAIYGSRASNGVVLITTKRGNNLRPEISFGAYYGSQKDWRRLPLLNAAQYNEVYNEGCRNRYGANCVTYTDEPNAAAPVPSSVAANMKAVRGADTDWQDAVLRSGGISTMEGSVRGGTESVRYYVTGSVLKQEGTQADLGYDKLNARVNLDYVPVNRITLGTNVALAHAVTKRAANDNTIVGGLATAVAMAPNIPIRNPDGTYYTGFYYNPVGNIQYREAEDRSVRIFANAFGVFSLAEGIDVRGAAGVDHYNLHGLLYQSPVYGNATAVGGRGTDGSSYVTKITYEGTVALNRALSADHAISGVVGSTYEDNVESGSTVTGSNFPNEFFKFLTSATTTTGSSTREDFGLMSFFGRLSYTWRDKVTTSFNVRRDGSSRFGENNRYGTFPSLSLNWRIGEESFLAGQSVVDNLSVRASYGITGNQQGLGNFSWRAVFNGGANYMDVPGISPARLSNPDLRWEKTKQFNIGTDFGLLDSRLRVAVDYYQKTTDDLLYTLPLPRSTGFSGITSNVGSMENKGFDIGVTADWVRANDGLNFSSTLSLSRNRNKVLSLYNDLPQLGTNAVIVGQPLGVFYGYVMDGIFQSIAEVQGHARQTVNANPLLATAAGDIRFKDLNGDGVINADDRQPIGNPWPDYEGGITNTASYKALDVTAFVQFSRGNEIYNGLGAYMDRYGSDGDNHTTRALERWTPTNPSNTQPRAVWGDPNSNTRTSSRFVEDGSFWRLKNLVVGFQLPESMLGAFKARSARVYFQGQNLHTSTKYSGFDPEVNSSGNSSITRGWDFYALPQPRTITFGINVGY
jgi:TonB-dependent starch-binding outer membrane protein SusC